ncbi:MAG TPA: CoA-acylating methylmalonate-semialdehyde dehydrogenase [Candidatus Limnocylindrales bacterium]|nr:CoA-acylating methylmalonate-semialdehyde dehydrogenase [Candidatus Limnocylindrales bacterium]
MIATKTVSAFIGGRFEEARSKQVDEIPNPATGETIAQLPHSTPDDINRAVEAAVKAFPSWSETPVPDRAQVLFRFKALFDQHVDELAAIVTRENGKTLDESRGEVKRAIEVIDFACGAPTLMMGQNLDQIARGIDEELTRFPVGVVAGITPFNFPNMVPLWMIPVALACGNTFVLKPSQLTPLSAMRIAELLVEAGVPDGVFNVVHGAKDTVDALLTHPDVAAISFVGSAQVAAEIYRNGAAHGKRVQALGGAKNHILVMDDADLERSAPHVVSSAFGNAGQRCLAGSVAVGVGKVGDALVSELRSEASKLRVGPGTDPKTTMGPVIRGERKRRLIEYIDEAQAQGAQLVQDGRDGGPKDGFFLGPTIFDRVTPDMRIWKDELFGPVLSVVRAADIDQALAILNSSTYGNMASIFTTSGKNAREFKRRAEAGMLGVNIGVAAPMAFFPFTGWKNSFFGDLHATGMDSVRFYTRHKVTTTRWL